MMPMLPVSLLKQLGPGIICQQDFSFDFLFFVEIHCRIMTQTSLRPDFLVSIIWLPQD